MRNDRIYIADLRRCKLCFQGSRPFFAKHGIPWNDFRVNGVDIELIRATGDSMALKVVKYVEGGRK